MIDNNKARLEVKLLKAMNDVSYTEFAEMCGLKKGVIYNWLNGSFELGEDRLAIVDELITDLKGE